MTEAQLRERLSALPVITDPDGQERAWRVVRSAYTPVAPRTRRPRRRFAVPAVASLIAVVAVALAAGSAPRSALARWFGNALGLTAQPRPRPVLAGLPSGGRLLVNSPDGPWIVGEGGVRHHLGVYTGAAWSPHSLYVVAWHDRRLAALNPAGRVQWAVTAGATVSAARWSTDGYRIAYLAGGSLGIVAGDGSGTHVLPVRVRAVTPTWQPHAGSAHRLALVTGTGVVQVRDADSGARVWSVRAPAGPQQLLWTPGGDRLIVVTPRSIVAYAAAGRLVARRSLPADQTVGAAAIGPDGRLAMVIHRGHGQPDSVELATTTPTGPRRPRVLFTAAERLSELTWSPNGRWLLVASPSADQWIFLRVAVPARISAVSQISAKFASRGGPKAVTRAGRTDFPSLGGWQP